MRLIHFFLFIFILNSGFSFGQLPANVEKLEGSWRYKEGSGYEIWKLKDDQLIGHAFRITKTGDTSKVEDVTIKKVNKRLLYNLSAYTNVQDSFVTTHRSFMGGKRKMNFINIEEEAPYSIEYLFGFFNRNKLKVIVLNRVNDRPQKYTLYRIKE